MRSDYPTLENYRLGLPGQTLGIAAPAVPKEDHADQLYNTVPLNKRAVKLMPKGVRGPLVEESSKYHKCRRGKTRGLLARCYTGMTHGLTRY